MGNILYYQIQAVRGFITPNNKCQTFMIAMYIHLSYILQRSHSEYPIKSLYYLFIYKFHKLDANVGIS